MLSRTGFDVIDPQFVPTATRKNFLFSSREENVELTNEQNRRRESFEPERTEGDETTMTMDTFSSSRLTKKAPTDPT